jgi:hypothetical protein
MTRPTKHRNGHQNDHPGTNTIRIIPTARLSRMTNQPTFLVSGPGHKQQNQDILLTDIQRKISRQMATIGMNIQPGTSKIGRDQL